MTKTLSTEVQTHVMYIKNILKNEPPERKFITKEQMKFVSQCKARKQSIQLSNGTMYEHRDILRLEPIGYSESESFWINMQRGGAIYGSSIDFGLCRKFIEKDDEKIELCKVKIEKKEDEKYIEKAYYYQTMHATHRINITKKGEVFRIVEDGITKTGESFLIHSI